MNTKKVVINPEAMDKSLIREMGEILKNGGLVSFPTETVYGLGANALDAEAVSGIFRAKGRPGDNPLIVHLADAKDVATVAREIPEAAEKLFAHFSPGPLTVILKKRPEIPEVVTAGLDTVAVRIPSHPIARELILSSGVPIAAPSSNLSGKPSPTKAEHVIVDMDGRVDAIIDGGECSVGLESTVIDVTGEYPTILRPGGVTPKEISAVLGSVRLDKHILKSVGAAEQPRCPGMKYRHYAPDADVVVFEGEPDKVYEKICEALRTNEKKPVGVLCLGKKDYDADVVLSVGEDSRAYAQKLFDALREFDRLGVKQIFAEFSIDDGFGLAVQNRLYKSAGNHVIHVE